MTREVILRQSGGSVSATLPKDMAARLHLEAGDRLLAVETSRGILLTPYNSESERALKVAGKVAKKYRNALRELRGQKIVLLKEPSWKRLHGAGAGIDLMTAFSAHKKRERERENSRS